MAISNRTKHEFNLLLEAAKAGTLCVIECTRIKDGKSVPLICVQNADGFIPVAFGLKGNPFNYVNFPGLHQHKLI
jgi:hypothetical protein